MSSEMKIGSFVTSLQAKESYNEVSGIDNARKSQILISSIILLKTALDAIPLLLKVLKDANSYLLGNVYRSVSLCVLICNLIYGLLQIYFLWKRFV
ncbi:DNA mismatch repair protein MSH4 [Camellia lanceoleosa]|uniref:DNA mismatch repair protein MSH4 n=1 Tax=Camellia lanceoleosa TaxID=1840588 RepID=A0ACC0I3P4_9ERIC|nr:DNA mismatch repair protein MSH4 [Camellia lanceoleosa]